MKIRSAEFVKSAFDRRHWVAGDLPEIAFLGRSNVGKSSLLNSLLARRNLARTSNTPGRTQSINYFLVNGEFYFVDLPGYGYAKVSKAIRSDWGVMARDYLTDRTQLVLFIQLVDSRHAPSELDRQLNDWLLENDKPHLVVATKSDKLSGNQMKSQLRLIGQGLPQSKILPYSTSKGTGRGEVWAEIEHSLKKAEN
ncbi:MAG: ribosome biogenesis GTP-binding protein YihA/YsxC [Pyrinomonadaceae bacterium]